MGYSLTSKCDLPLRTHVSQSAYSKTRKKKIETMRKRKKDKTHVYPFLTLLDRDDDAQHTHERFDAVHKHHPEVRADTPRRCVINSFVVFAKLSNNVVKRRERNENAAPSS